MTPLNDLPTLAGVAAYINSLACALIAGCASSLATTAWQRLRYTHGSLRRSLQVAFATLVTMCLSAVFAAAHVLIADQMLPTVAYMTLNAGVAGWMILIATGRLPNPIVELR